MLLLGALLLLAPTPAGPAADSSTKGAAAERQQCLAVEISSARETPGRVRPGHMPSRVFSASRSLDLIFRTQLRRRSDGTQTVEFRVRAPRGFLYQSLAVPVTPPPTVGPEGGNRRSAPPSSRSRLEATATLPVAGTAITTNSLYGRWTVEPLLDGTPCGSARSFNLMP